MSTSKGSAPYRQPPIRALGPPRPGQGRVVPDLPQAATQLWKRLYIRGVDDDLEKLHGYRPGGYHPIHLQDELQGGQYRVIHKLGHGGFSTVWLCRDQYVETPAYVAIKILVASETEKHSFETLPAGHPESKGTDRITVDQHICLPLKQFTSNSANGTHICLVYPVLGPTVSNAADVFDEKDDVIEILQSLSRQVIEALAALHSHDICHGDFRASNILLELQGLDGLDEKDLLSLLGEPETTEIYIRKDSHPTPEIPYAPKCLVYPIDFMDANSSIILPRVQVIDLGQSFNVTRRPLPSTFGIPVNYAAPEIFFDKSGSSAMDLWSLACTIFEIRLGRPLFDVFRLITVRKQEYLLEIASVLGEPPLPWAEYYPESGNGSETGTSQSDSGLEDGIDGMDSCSESQTECHRLMLKKLASCDDCAGKDCTHQQFQTISRSEAVTLADLLEKLLKYQPQERICAQDLLKHTWFHTRYRRGLASL